MFVEKQPPYGVACYTLDEEARRVGWIQAEHDLQRYHQCMETKEWPAYPAEVRTLDLAQWQLRGRIS